MMCKNSKEYFFYLKKKRIFYLKKDIFEIFIFEHLQLFLYQVFNFNKERYITHGNDIIIATYIIM